MRALALTDFETGPALQDLPAPEPGSGQVRVRVEAAGLNGIDTAISTGMVKGMAEYVFPVVIGRDAAGIVDAVGDGVDHVSVGDEVIGHVFFGPTLHEGTIAEYAVLSGDGVVHKPTTLEFTAAAALPLAGADRLEALGASKIVDYRDDVAEQVLADGGEVDALLDLVSFDPESFGKVAKAVRRGGKVGSTAGGATDEALAAAGLTGKVIFATPDRETLTALLGEIERGALRVDVELTVPLEEATEGLEKLAGGHAQGKIVVTVAQ
jgi:NADPH:quinone reductase-like Zn-dependent oxidoreductase